MSQTNNSCQDDHCDAVTVSTREAKIPTFKIKDIDECKAALRGIEI